MPAFQPLNYPHSVYVCIHFCTSWQCSKTTYFGFLLLQGNTKEDKRGSVAGYIQVAPRAINTFTSLKMGHLHPFSVCGTMSYCYLVYGCAIQVHNEKIFKNFQAEYFAGSDPIIFRVHAQRAPWAAHQCTVDTVPSHKGGSFFLFSNTVMAFAIRKPDQWEVYKHQNQGLAFLVTCTVTSISILLNDVHMNLMVSCSSCY